MLRAMQKLNLEMLIIIASLIINFLVMVQWFTTLENRLTKIETTIDIKLNDKQFNHYYQKQNIEKDGSKT
jgi:ribosome-associated toxin RatA of RatAB toxin-antitoxin module